MLAGKNLVTSLHNELEAPVIEPIPGVVGYGGGFLQRGVRGDHLARHQILADTEVLQGALCLSTPKFIGRNVHLAKAIGLLPNVFDLVRIHLPSSPPEAVICVSAESSFMKVRAGFAASLTRMCRPFSSLTPARSKIFL